MANVNPRMNIMLSHIPQAVQAEGSTDALRDVHLRARSVLIAGEFRGSIDDLLGVLDQSWFMPSTVTVAVVHEPDHFYSRLISLSGVMSYGQHRASVAER